MSELGSPDVSSVVDGAASVVDGALSVLSVLVVAGGVLGLVTVVEASVETTGDGVVDSADGTGAPTETGRTVPSNEDPSISRTRLPRPSTCCRLAPGTAAATVSASAR